MSSPSPSNNTPPYPQGPPAGRRASERSKLRVGTFIEPSTGEQSRRTFTLRLPLRRRSIQASLNGNGASASTAILPVFSDQEQSISERSRAAAHNLRAGVVRGFRWLNSPTGRGVLKCTLAYTIASLATFLAPISDFLGKPDGKHVVATITVCFHPARSAGSMIEAVLIAIVAVAYAQVVSILSMCTSVLFGNVWGNPALAHILVLVIFIGGGFGFIGWLEQRMNNPLVNVGSALASLAIIGVVTKETAVLTSVFSNQKIIQILKMLVMGITITTLVNLLVWRVSAVHLLRKSMTQTSAALGDMLAVITHGFLSGAEDELLSREFNAASAAYKSVYPQLTENLREAKFERYFLGQEKIYQLDRAVVKSMETLAQSIGGLRSAANTQFALLKESFEQADQPLLSPRMQRTASTILKSGKDRSSVLQAIREASDEGDDDGVLPGNRRRSDVSIAPSFRNSGEIFELFIALLGPSMKSLAYTLSEVLRDPPFGSAPKYEILIDDQFRQSLADALGLFNDARAGALHELYKYLEMDRTRSEQIQADFEEVAAACGHFSFSLQSFAEEMQKYLDVLDDLKHESQFKRRSWHWLVWWRSKDHHGRFFPALPYNQVPEEQEGLIKPIKKTAIPKGIPDSMVQRRDTYNWEAAKDQSSGVVATLSQKLLRLMRRLARDDVRFGLKVGIGAILWAMFAFIPQTRDTYQHWRGEWGFLSFMIVCSMTVGAANTAGWAGFLGTVIGAGAAYVNWNVTHGNALGLIVLGWLMAFWSFWIMMARGQAPLGRITLLAYNVSTLYAYSLSQKVDDDDDDEGGSHPIIGEIVRHRFIAVAAGILWGLIVCRVIWPISARKKFHQGLSMLYLQMGLIWKRGPLAILLRSDCSRSYLKSGEMTALKKYAARLDALRASAVSEFQLRGPFPAAQASRLMQCASRLLDAFYAMSLVAQRRGHLTEGERALLLYTAEERKALCDRICHVFQVLASSLMLEYPLTDAIPSVLGQRDKLLAKIFLFRKEHMPSRTLQNLNTDRDRAPESPTAAGRADSYVTAASSLSFGPTGFGQNTGNGSWNNSLRGSIDESLEASSVHMNPLAHVTLEERDYALLYACALVTGQVAEELSEVAKEIEGLFGVLDGESILLQ